MQADPGLHRIDQRGIEQQQPERGGAERLPAREGRLRRGKSGCDRQCRVRFHRDHAVGREAEILRPAHHKEPGRDKAYEEGHGADRQPAGAPALHHHRQLGDQRHRHQPDLLRQRRDRAGEGAAPDEPVVERAVEAELERRGPIHPRHAEQQIEHQERPGQRQQHQRDGVDQDGGAQHEPRPLAVEHRPDQWRDQRREHAAQ